MQAYIKGFGVPNKKLYSGCSYHLQLSRNVFLKFSDAALWTNIPIEKRNVDIAICKCNLMSDKSIWRTG